MPIAKDPFNYYSPPKGVAKTTASKGSKKGGSQGGRGQEYGPPSPYTPAPVMSQTPYGPPAPMYGPPRPMPEGGPLATQSPYSQPTFGGIGDGPFQPRIPAYTPPTFGGIGGGLLKPRTPISYGPNPMEKYLPPENPMEKYLPPKNPFDPYLNTNPLLQGSQAPGPTPQAGEDKRLVNRTQTGSPFKYGLFGMDPYGFNFSNNNTFLPTSMPILERWMAMQYQNVDDLDGDGGGGGYDWWGGRSGGGGGGGGGFSPWPNPWMTGLYSLAANRSR